MKVPDKLIRVSRASILEKLFDVDPSKLSRKELKKVEKFLPTDEEREFMDIYRSNIPQLQRLQRKMSVCLAVEVTELEEDRISFLFGKDTFTLKDPENAFRMAQVLEKGTLEAVAELAAQKCLLKNGEPVENVKTGSLKVDELGILQKVANRFFFQSFLA